MKLLLGLIVSLFFSYALFAQNGTLRGVVTDESGAIVPGAKITLTANAGTPNTAVAGDDGSYSFTAITPGEYVAEASAPDLAVAPLKVMIRPGAQILNLQLKVASVTQQVTVEDRAVTVTPEPANNASATVLAGDDLLILTERGELSRASASPAGFKTSARAQVLSNQVRAHPALANGFFYARSKDKLVCLSLRKAP